MKLLTNPLLLRIFVLLVFLNTIVITGSQWFVYQKHFDLYWFGSFFYRELILCMSYFLLFWFLSFLPQTLQKILGWGILALSFVCFIIDIFLLYTFDTSLNSYLVIVTLETNPQESKEFLSHYVRVPLFIIYGFFVFCFFILWRFVKPLYVNPKHSRMFIILSICVIVFVSIVQPKPYEWTDLLSHYAKQIFKAVDGTRKFMEEYKNLNAKFDTLASHLDIKPSKDPIQNLVLIIGESTQKARMSLYGYPLSTTPLLDELRAQKPDNFFVFTNVISSHAQTHESLSLALTFANQDSQGLNTNALAPKQKIKKTPWYEHLNIFDALKLGGYYTLAFSNQESISLWGNSATSILNRANDVEYVNISDKMNMARFDEELLKLLDLRLKGQDTESVQELQVSENAPRFYALHLMGSHAKYYNRYPLEFARFSAEDMEGQGFYRAKESDQENSHYLNSIVYGDFVVREIIKRFEDLDSLVIYFSDHGEEVYDWRSFIGHSDSKISRLLVEVPFMIYVSEGFKAKHPALYKRIKKAQHQKYMHDDLMHTLLDISGVRLKGYEPKRSIFSSNTKFLDSRLRIVGSVDNPKNYDKDLYKTLKE